MLYENKRELTKEEFENPGKEYRGAPFWAWNGEVKKEILKKQMEDFKEMGMGGFHIHSRIGLKTPYLEEEFMDCVRYCSRFAKENGMLTWLYDEDKWPSGYGGGRVTKEERFRNRYLLFSKKTYEEGQMVERKLPPRRVSADGKARLLMKYRVKLENGRLAGYESCRAGQDWTENREGEVWYAYLIVTKELSWFNDSAYVDVMNPDAVRRFTQVTHDVYAKELGEEFGKSVPAIFTDEPQMNRFDTLSFPEADEEIGIPYTDRTDELYRMSYGESILERLPEVFWENEDGKPFAARYRYLDFISEQFARAYAGTIGKWCRAHGLFMTGHLMMEPTLDSQSRHVGEAMRSYREFGIPGIDMLADRHEYTTAKQAQSAAHQFGCPGVASELYGVTNWNFEFRGHKHQGDWQAALGVTVRVPHLSWMYMGGESKRDYPAPIDAHSPWYKRYRLIEDHFARLNTALTRGKARVNVGVIHPVESYWMFMGPDSVNAGRRQELEEHFADLTEWLLFGLCDFDFISESLLPVQYGGAQDGRLRVGEMEYQAVIVPGLVTMRSTTLEILKIFKEQGGTIIFIGQVPKYKDGSEDEEAARFAKTCRNVGFDRFEVVRAVKPFCEIEVLNERHLPEERIISQMRDDGKERWLFLANGRINNAMETENLGRQVNNRKISIRIKGRFRAHFYNTMTGNISQAETIWEGENTRIDTYFYDQDSLLFRLVPADSKEILEEMIGGENLKRLPARELMERGRCVRLPVSCEYSLDEPNVFLLDMAEYRVDKKEWRAREEILRIDSQVRKEAGYKLRTDSFLQPWLDKGPQIKEHLVELLFEVESETDVEEVLLAFEGDEDVTVEWNGESGKEKQNRGRYLDDSIRLISLGNVKKGKNRLKVTVPFGSGTNLEWCYLLGNFCVWTGGGRSVIMEKTKRIGFGDYTCQGFPFYGGNFTYIIKTDTPKGRGILEIPNYRGALMDVWVDGERKDPVFMEPFRTDLGELKEGTHEIRILLYGTRINMFGQLHNCDEKEAYWGPKTWRTEGKSWTYTHRLHENGILTEPLLYIIE
ncbi:hypothetical protein C0033_04075 [Clostridium sp. chh4-2]|uniref:glycosyl hydrolase n=1 Tax=Clostridium sp. chh4-2 TaxID=2067550 RepID=UPI000CCF4E58|nr:glycosyl hydrolase [Clostridium sp. chh4-2]PNV63269.1 hypothetical protein C0033_04075 [Clostridium sp. chh4-2]